MRKLKGDLQKKEEKAGAESCREQGNQSHFSSGKGSHSKTGLE